MHIYNMNVVYILPLTRMPVDSTPLCSSPLHPTPLDTIPLDSTPLDTTPFDTTPFDSTPFECTPFDTACTPLVASPHTSEDNFSCSSLRAFSILLSGSCARTEREREQGQSYHSRNLRSTVESVSTTGWHSALQTCSVDSSSVLPCVLVPSICGWLSSSHLR